MVLRSDQRRCCSLDLRFLDTIQREFHVHVLFCPQVSDAKKSDIEGMEGMEGKRLG